MNGTRKLLITADDYGIGPETSRAIRELGATRLVTSTVLLVNSPHAESDIALWKIAGCPVEMGWHPNLTMDQPILPPHRVPSLVDRRGHFLSLATLSRKLFLGLVKHRELRDELAAQYRRHVELVGRHPWMVNGHKHIHIFPMVGAALREVLSDQKEPCYLRHLGEPTGLIRSIPGARLKRVFLTTLGRWSGRKQSRSGFWGNEVLAGITDPIWVQDPDFFIRWLQQVPGQVVELMVHPGHYDTTLLQRDCTDDEGLRRRVDEWQRLTADSFLEACDRAGFQRISAEELIRSQGGIAHAA